MWANAQRDVRPAEYSWRPLFNAAKFDWRPLGLLHCVSKNVPPLICYNFYCATPNSLCFCTTWQNGEHENRIFFTQMLYQCITRNQLVAAWFLQSFWLTNHTHAIVWLPKSCNQCVRLGAVGDMVQEKGSWERCSSWTVLHAQRMCTKALSSWTKQMSSAMCLSASNICWASKISH